MVIHYNINAAGNSIFFFFLPFLCVLRVEYEVIESHVDVREKDSYPWLNKKQGI